MHLNRFDYLYWSNIPNWWNLPSDTDNKATAAESREQLASRANYEQGQGTMNVPQNSIPKEHQSNRMMMMSQNEPPISLRSVRKMLLVQLVAIVNN